MKLIKDGIYKIFRTKPKDWEGIKREIIKIENSAFEEEARQDEDDIEETFTYDKSICLVAVDEGLIVGYTMGAPLDWYLFLEDDPHYGKGDSFYIESTAVLPEYQEKGIGKVMKKALIDEVKKEYSRITCHATNEIIKHLNEKLGFRNLEYIKEWIEERDAWYMELKLLH